jgi:hypothetical protein
MSRVFVFGSNLAGLHYGGSAAHAHKAHGAEWGVGVGITGNSYAIPTLDADFKPLSLEVIQRYVSDFMAYAKANNGTGFDVVAIGCGVAGFTPEQIAPMFAGYNRNVCLPDVFLEVLL